MNHPLHDLHIHTHLSACSDDPMQTVENIIDYAVKNGIPTIGITDHVWDNAIPGSSDWYAPQDFEHVMQVRQSIPSDLRGVRVLIGAETEYAAGVVALTREHRDQLDYVIVPHSHIHMRGLVLPEDCVTDQQVASYLVSSFCSLVEKDFATAIAHPFFPVGRTQQNAKEIFDCITDDEFARCFTLAKDHNTAIEINGDTFPSVMNNPVLLANHERLFSIARDCGVTFTLGSDAHTLDGLNTIHNAVTMANNLNIPDDRFLRI